MKLFSTVLLLCTSLLYKQQGCAQQEQMNVIRIEFEGHRYDSLSLEIRLQGSELKRISISGYSEDGYLWEFSYPDNLYDSIALFTILGLRTDVASRRRITFSHVLHGDTLISNGFFFKRDTNTHIRARYIETRVWETFLDDIFEISADDIQMVAALKAIHSEFMLFNQQFTYEENIQNYMKLVRQYPDSRRFVALVANNMGRFRSIADIAKLFNLFSEEIQQSFFGQRIYQHITRDMTFINQKLATWDTGLLEKIVQDSSRYNLILFSASWCGPCIRQIPILKEFYRDLGQKLTMTYVSLDHERTAENWREKMRSHEIPWRSLMVLTQEKDRAISGDYGVFGVPTAILVHPNSMKMEKLDLWVEEHRQRLYEFVTKQ